MSWTRKRPTEPGTFYYRTWNTAGLVFLGWGSDRRLWVCHFTSPDTEPLESFQPVCLWHPVPDAPPVPDALMRAVFDETEHPESELP